MFTPTTKTIDEIHIDKRVYSESTNKWMLRGRDKKTNQDGILVCLELAEGVIRKTGNWLNLE
jgi:hypothetical protein